MREWEYERLAQLHSEVIPHFYVLCGLREPSVAESNRYLSMCLSGIAAEAPEAERTKKGLLEDQREAFLSSEGCI